MALVPKVGAIIALMPNAVLSGAAVHVRHGGRGRRGYHRPQHDVTPTR
jgi:hypothetical protein